MINKAVYSNWSKPNNDQYAGFRTPEAFVNSLRLSLLFSKKWFKETELITDKKGYELLIEKHNLPFDNVEVCLDDLNHINQKHWAIGKLVACSMQNKPFMHIDNDVYWFKKPKKHLLVADACFQNKESAKDGWYLKQRELAARTSPIKEINYKQNKALNCGIIGFNKLDIIEQWLSLAFEYIKWYDSMPYIQNELSSIMFEQYHLPQLLESNNYKVETITGTLHVDDWKTKVDPDIWFINDDRAKDYGYTHLISTSKRRIELEERVAQRLYEESGDDKIYINGYYIAEAIGGKNL